MANVQSGSSILLVLMVMSILTIVCLTTYKNSLFFADFARHTIKAEQHFMLAKGLLEYGIGYVSTNFDKLALQPGPIQMEIHIDEYKTGILMLMPATDSIHIQADLQSGQKSIGGTECTVIKQADGKLAIEGFQRAIIAL